VSEQPLDLKASLKVIWRRRWLVGALALVGFAGGVAHEALMPPLPKARALVLVPSSSLTNSSGAQVDDTPTQIIIATSTPVLAAAGAAVSPPISPTALKSDVSVSALSPDVLQFQVTASSATDAEKLANADATAYIAYVNKTGSLSNTGVLPALQQQASRLAGQVDSLQQQINSATAKLAAAGAGTTAGQRDSALLASLGTEQEEVSLQLNSVNNEIVSTQLSGSLSASATRVLQTAAVVPLSKTQIGLYPFVGLATGLFVGCLLVFVRSRGDRRLRLRDELAGAIGVPVLASLECTACKSAKDWKRLLEKYQPSPVDSWNLRRLLHGLLMTEEEHGLQLNVVAFADDSPSLAAAVQLAKSAAELGMPTALVPGDHASLGLLRAACTVLGAPAAPNEPLTFQPKKAGTEFSSARLTLSLMAVDEAKPELTITNGASVLAVSSGFATPEALARVALVVSDAGHPIDGIVVVNPDPEDTTVGIVPMAGDGRLVPHQAAQRSGTERSLGQFR
jgi:capsular polysaccharide biosynthesis protein